MENKDREMNPSYSIIPDSKGFYDLFENVINSDGSFLSQTLVKQYKTKKGAENALRRYDMKKQYEEGKELVENLDLSEFKLLPNAKPGLFHYHTVRINVKNIWTKKVRPTILEQKGKVCSVCGWIPENDEELKKLHMHEVEEYDYQNMVCHLKDIELLCSKCHAFHHIARTKSYNTKEQWEDLLNHFVQVNGCTPEIAKHWTLFEMRVFQVENEKEKKRKNLPPLHELMKKTVRYTISPDIPFSEEMTKQLEKKGLLYIPQPQQTSK